MESIYTNGIYLQKNPNWHKQDASWKLRHVLLALRKAGLPGQIRTVCDVGCGCGELLKQWARKETEVHFTGYEISPQAYALCLEQAPKNVSFINTEPTSESCFDVALAIDVLEHVPEPEEWLSVLEKQAEVLVLHIPLDLSFRTLLQPEILEQERQSVGHIHFFTAPYLKRLFKARGYTVLSWHYTNKYVECPPVLTRIRSRVGMLIRKAAHVIMPHSWAAWWVGGYSVMAVCAVKRKAD